MMNQAASATRRPAGSNATNGCCPMFNTPFFVNTFSAPQVPLIPPANQCYLGPQAPQIQLPSSQPVQQPPQQQQQQQQQPQSQQQQQQLHHQRHGAVLPPTSLVGQQQQQSVAPSNVANSHQPRQQEQPSQPYRLRNQANTYNTSPLANSAALSLQNLIASRVPASDCVALAAALASANFPPFHQLQQAQQQQIHLPTPINQSTSTSNTLNPVQLTSETAAATATNHQVPISNFNSYNAAQPFLSSSGPVSQPMTAHLNLSNNTSSNINNTNHQQPNSTSLITTDLASIQASQLNGFNHVQVIAQPNAGPNQQQQLQQQRPLANNTTLNNAANQQQPSNHRSSAPNATPLQSIPPSQPQQPLAQQLGPMTRNFLSDETLNLFNAEAQAMLLYQILGQQFAPPMTLPPTFQPQQQPMHPQLRTSQQQQQQQQQPPSSTIGSVPFVMAPIQQQIATTTPVVPQSAPQLSQEQVSGQQQAFQPQQSRLTQVPIVDSLSSVGLNSATGGQYQQHQHSGLVNNQLQGQNPQFTNPQMEQALTILTNARYIPHLLHQFVNLVHNMRTEPQHPNQNPSLYHQHLHGAHHHHHHGANAQGTGQDVTMPLDSLAISESKPRGLNRAEIDSLTPYIHMNEKDSRTCVICLSKFELKSKIRPLPCNHAFHAKCVDKWLRANRTCPICRRDALKTYGAKIKRV